MSVRFLTMTALTAGFLLVLPGVVSASGKHVEKHANSGQAIQHVNVDHSVQKAKRTVNAHPNESLKKVQHAASNVSSQVDHALKTNEHRARKALNANTRMHPGQAAVHASKQALDHAAAESAVHRTINKKPPVQTSEVGNQGSTQFLHKNQKQDQKISAKLNKTSKTAKRKVKPVVIQADSTQKHKTRKPKQSVRKKKPKTKSVIKAKSSDQGRSDQSNRKAPLPESPSPPLAALTPSAPLTGLSKHSQPGNGKGPSGGAWANFGILPSQHANGAFTKGILVPRMDQYGNQWINAPPSPPPRKTFFFTTANG